MTAVACLAAGIAIGVYLGAEWQHRISARHAARQRAIVQHRESITPAFKRYETRERW